MEFDTDIDFRTSRKLKRIISKLNDDQMLIISSTCHSSGFTHSRRMTVKDLRLALKDPKFYTDYHYLGVFICFQYHDYYSIEFLSEERLAEVIAREKAEAEIALLEEAGITGAFYYNEVEFGNPILLTTPDDIIELAEKIKAFRAKKQKNQG